MMMSRIEMDTRNGTMQIDSNDSMITDNVPGGGRGRNAAEMQQALFHKETIHPCFHGTYGEGCAKDRIILNAIVECIC